MSLFIIDILLKKKKKKNQDQDNHKGTTETILSLITVEYVIETLFLCFLSKQRSSLN